ncbi:hypothetical protein Ddye_004009 [Dipteronia dyeriana]|uniref:DUF8204 domain-containing protein n=1 Tax=Dipteronia dyeriana TaxID=168575 RepID=A0AAD9XU26_9ROSI|nr:hypothetical protein Ddye_004009 [Dipteronia dyeriana]
MEADRDDRGNELQNQNPNRKIDDNNNTSQTKSFKGKSCKGCLYYSSALKSNSRNPVCVGIPRTLQQVPRYVVGETELEASKEGRNLKDFKYGCVGYSVYLDNKDSSTEQLDKQAELPFCVGLEVLLDRRPSTSDHVPSHVHHKEDGRALPQPQTAYKPAAAPAPARTPAPASAPFPGDEYLSRFKRNAGLVAAGVAKNVNKVGIYIKETLEDIVYPYRRK